MHAHVVHGWCSTQNYTIINVPLTAAHIPEASHFLCSYPLGMYQLENGLHDEIPSTCILYLYSGSGIHTTLLTIKSQVPVILYDHEGQMVS